MVSLTGYYQCFLLIYTGPGSSVNRYISEIFTSWDYTVKVGPIAAKSHISLQVLAQLTN